MTKLIVELPENAVKALHEIAAAYNVPFDKLVTQAILHDIDMELGGASDMTQYEAKGILQRTGYVMDTWQEEFVKAGWLKGV